jgi:hypothetical protein
MVFSRAVTSADGAVVTGDVRIRKLVFNAAAAADTCAIKNAAGTVILTLNGSAATSSQECDFGEEGLKLIGGYQVSAITAGDTLYVFIL